MPLEEMMFTHSLEQLVSPPSDEESMLQDYARDCGVDGDHQVLMKDSAWRNDAVNGCSEVYLRSIRKEDRVQIQKLHEEWFPVTYQDDFYDNLVEGRMANSGESLFTCLAVRRRRKLSSLPMEEAGNATLARTTTTTASEDIAACVVGAFVDKRVLSEVTRSLLISNPNRYHRLFYIMTLGTASEYRNAGLGTLMIEKCIEQVEADSSCGVLYLHVIVTNQSAIRFYEKLNFYRVKEIPDYYTIDGVNYNCYLYARYFHGNQGHFDIYKLIYRTFALLWRQLRTPLSLLIGFDDVDQRENR